MGLLKTILDLRVRQAALLKHLSFSCAENQTAVGTIEDALATSFTIYEGGDDFTINNSGVIAFKVAPDYETKSEYTLRVISSRGRKYKVTVNVTEVISSFALNFGTVLNLATAV